LYSTWQYFSSTPVYLLLRPVLWFHTNFTSDVAANMQIYLRTGLSKQKMTFSCEGDVDKPDDVLVLKLARPELSPVAVCWWQSYSRCCILVIILE